MAERPSAEELLPYLFEPGSTKLLPHARRAAASEWCPEGHLLARVVRIPAYGVLVQWRSGWTSGPDWHCAWLDEVPDPTAVNTLCGPCRGMVWLIDLTAPGRPQRRMPPTAMR